MHPHLPQPVCMRFTHPHPCQSVCLQLTGPQSCQCVCICKQHIPNPSSIYMQVHASTCKQMHPQSHQRICTQCKRVSGHVRTSAKQANTSLVTFSTPASRPTCPPLWYCFFSICFVSLTICPQPHQRVCTQANASAFKQICSWPRQHESFFLFLLFH